ncbi:MAG: hypothetical protein J6T94_04710 [Bacteroidaceae bacterium]|nr:hypothetical protein [Bacteroidaceae bacterium]
MLNSEQHLFIFEGGRDESRFVDSLEQCFLGEKISVKCAYEAEIYQLYEQLKGDGFSIDMVELLKERNAKNAKILKDYTRDSFAYIYLFFDYDAHSSLASDDKLAEMLNFFDNETENGLLYISYPMLEAIRHYKDMGSFKELTVKCKRANCIYRNDCEDADTCMNEPHYKTFSAQNCRPQMVNINKYSKEIWNELILAHIYKMNYLVNEVFEFPAKTETQSTVFSKQQEKHINHRCPEVAVLSAFPIYALDYFGVETLRKKLIM